MLGRLFLLTLLALSVSSFKRGRSARPVSLVHQSIGTLAETTLQAQSDLGGAFASSFVAQKNYVLLEKLEHPEDGDYASAAMSYVNFCDESFNKFLNERITEADSDEEKQRLGKVRYEINSARQKKLMEADKLLRGILASGGLKQIEAKLAFHLRRAEIDMAFMVILELNIEDAMNNGVEKAVQVLTHLKTLINEHQDDMVSPPVKLMRLLMRTDDENIRKQMLRQKLLIGDNVKVDDSTGEMVPTKIDEEGNVMAGDTTVPQCEHIIIPGVGAWGGADVEVDELRETITDVLAQMSEVGGDPDTLEELEAKCATLRWELDSVLHELTLPPVSDQVDNCTNDSGSAAGTGAGPDFEMIR